MSKLISLKIMGYFTLLKLKKKKERKSYRNVLKLQKYTRIYDRLINHNNFKT